MKLFIRGTLKATAYTWRGIEYIFSPDTHKSEKNENLVTYWFSNESSQFGNIKKEIFDSQLLQVPFYEQALELNRKVILVLTTRKFQSSKYQHKVKGILINKIRFYVLEIRVGE